MTPTDRNFAFSLAAAGALMFVLPLGALASSASPSPMGTAVPGSQPMTPSQPAPTQPQPRPGVSSAQQISDDIAMQATRNAKFAASSGAQLGPYDVALNGGTSSDGSITIVAGDNQTYDANCNKQTVEIGGDGGTVTLHGPCTFVRLSGNNVTLHFDRVDDLIITGNNDRYTYVTKPGSVEQFNLSPYGIDAQALH